MPSETEDIPPWEEQPPLKSSNDDDVFRAVSEPDAIAVTDSNNKGNDFAGMDDDDDELSDDIMSSPWIKKL